MVLLAELMSMNRLPAAEPSVLTGDNINQNDWKALLMALIDSRCSPSTEKMHYLRRYIGGEVSQVINFFLTEYCRGTQRRLGDTIPEMCISFPNDPGGSEQTALMAKAGPQPGVVEIYRLSKELVRGKILCVPRWRRTSIEKNELRQNSIFLSAKCLQNNLLLTQPCQNVPRNV